MRRRAFLGTAILGTVGSSSLTAQSAEAVTRRPMRTLPTPVASLVTRWDADPWSLGSYSALPPGTSGSARAVLAGLLLGDRIALAGEYARVDAPATTHGALESGRSAARRLLRSAEPARVLVVGAGIAGAGAAQRLHEAGVAVTVLEARDRVGGRIHADTTWGAPVEMGAAWIHGVTGNPVTGLARAAGLSLVPMDWANAITRDTVTGRASPPADAADARLQTLMDELAEAEPPVRTSTAAWLRSAGWRSDRLNAWAQAVQITQEYGRDPAGLGVRAFSEGAWQRGGDVLVGGNYGTVVTDLLDGIEVRLGSAVASVTASTDGVVAELDSGERIRAEAAVVAVPLALLQRSRPRIQPWPTQAQRAMDSLVTGNLEKVVLRYDEPWWGEVRAIGVVGGGVPGAPAGSQAALRWTELVNLDDLLGFPALVAFSGGSAATTRPPSDGACVAEAVSALEAAFRA